MRNVIFALLLSVLVAADASAATWYVDKDNAGSQDGMTWGAAFTEIQLGIGAAAGDGGGEVWVAEGAYGEARTDPDGSLVMAEGVDIYGGFAGGESDLSERDWVAHVTTIDGSAARGGEAAYHAVKGANNAILDGFTITGGNASLFGATGCGGGMYNASVSPTVRNCIFVNNSARRGGGMYNSATDLLIVVGCSFVENSAIDQGGGMYNIDLTCTPVLRRCIFTGNSAQGDGGAMYNWWASPVIANCMFSGNTVDSDGGAMYNRWTGELLEVRKCLFSRNSATNGGGVFNDTLEVQFERCAFFENSASAYGGGVYNENAFPSSSQLTTCVFLGNEAVSGGGVYNADLATSTELNCTFSLNLSDTDGGAVYSQGAAATTATSSIFWMDSTLEIFGNAAVTYCDVQGGILPGLGNISWHPNFVDLAQGNLRLNNASPCIGTGKTDGAPPYDILGVTMPVPTGGMVEMGAYEYTSAPSLTAAFNAVPDGGVAPLAVQFVDASIPAGSSIVGWLWDFGDGSTSMEQNPQHIFGIPGDYTVILMTPTLIGMDYATKDIHVSGAPTAAFSADVTTGVAPFTVHFADLSDPGAAPIETWSWDFDGDEVEDSDEPNPTNVYETPGLYTVSLSVTTSLASDTETKTNYITVLTPPAAAFSATPLYGLTPLAVEFTDESDPGDAPITIWSWDFDGDSVEDSNEPSPTHIYEVAGVYTVSLTVTTVLASDTETKTDYITVDTLPTAAFTAEPTVGYFPLYVEFTDESDPGNAPITLWEWDLDGNGTVDSEEQHPRRTYDTENTYTVTLSVTTAVGGDTSAPQTITVAEPVVLSLGPEDPKRYIGENVCFTLEATGGLGALAYQWWFDDGQKAAVQVGSNMPWLAISPVDEADAGLYWCAVTDQITAHYATAQSLGVAPYLQIVQHPEGGDKVAGEAHTFWVGTSGGFQPLAYVWQKNSITMPGATAWSHTLDPLKVWDTGQYRVIVADSHTSVLTSNEAVLNVDDRLPVVGIVGLGLLAGVCVAAGALVIRRK